LAWVGCERRRCGAGGVIPLHDEDAIFAKEANQLQQAPPCRRSSLNLVASLTACKAVILEGLEVVFIVIAVGAGRGLLLPASLGAPAACAVVLMSGAIVRRPLSRVPENTLKFAVGVMLSAFGVLWLGEGLGIAWPGGDLMLPVSAGLFLGAGLLGAAIAREKDVEAVA
jgi:uncharacterized membrane protein